jgi:hypothetical protein
MISCIFGQTQVPEGGFENWSASTGGYEEPNGGWWTSLNTLKALGAPVTLSKTTDAHSGNFAAMLETKQWGSFLLPGLLVSGNFITSSPFVIQGKPFTELPVKFKGYYKYISVNNDSAAIFAMLTRYDNLNSKRDTIAEARFAVLNTTSSYTFFEIDFNYHITGVNPDSIDVVFSSSAAGSNFQGQIGSTLFVDDVSLEYATGISENIISKISIDVFPNPTTDDLNICSFDNAFRKSTFIVYSEDGRQIFKFMPTENSYLLNSYLFNSGRYLLNVYNENRLIATKRFSVLH